MTGIDRRAALLRVLAAAAWADGRLDNEEINRIKDLARAFDAGPEVMREVESLLQAPVSAARCEELTRDLLDRLPGDRERHEVLDEIEKLFQADGVVDPAEREVLDNLRGILASQSTVEGFMSRIKGVFRGLVPRSDAAGELSEYVKNPVLRRLDDISGGGWQESMTAADLNRHTLFGAVLGKVAATEDGIAPEELERIRSILGTRAALAPPMLDWVTRAVAETASGDLDRQGLLSEYNRVATMDQRRELLDAAFAVAAADGTIGPDELEELRLISNFLWIDPRDFNGVRRRYGA